MDREEIIWAAGLFEGEGCFSIMGRADQKHRYPTAKLCMTDLDVVERFRAALPFERNIHNKKKPPGCKPAFELSYQGLQQVQAIGAMFWPWLGARRRARFKEVLEAYTGNSMNRPLRGYYEHKAKGA